MNNPARMSSIREMNKTCCYTAAADPFSIQYGTREGREIIEVATGVHSDGSSNWNNKNEMQLYCTCETNRLVYLVVSVSSQAPSYPSIHSSFSFHILFLFVSYTTDSQHDIAVVQLGFWKPWCSFLQEVIRQHQECSFFSALTFPLPIYNIVVINDKYVAYFSGL